MIFGLRSGSAASATGRAEDEAEVRITFDGARNGPRSPFPSGWRDWLVALGFVAAIAVPRLAPFPPAHVTWDEMQIALWAEQGGRALRERRWAATANNAYPAAALAWLELAPGLDPAIPTPSSPEDRQAAFASLPDRRRRLAFADALVVLAVLAAAARLLGRATAVTAGLLMAFDPWLLSQARLFRVEALSTDLTALSLVVALLAAGRRSHRLAALSGVAAAAAAVTKVTALYLAVIVPVAFGLASLVSRREDRLRRACAQTLIWIASLTVTALILWPAMWASPEAAFRMVTDYLLIAATKPPPGWVGGLPPPPFFAGQVTADPGPWFYPANLLLRLAPLTCIGLVLWGLGLRRRWRDHRVGPGGPLVLDVTFALFVVGLVALFSLATAKAAHYLLPAVPLLILLAAIGLTSGVAGRRRQAALWGTCGLVGLLTCVWHHPYYSTSWNLLLGGGRVAVRQVPMGQHEGIATLIQRLAREKQASAIRLASPWTMACEATFPGTCLPQEGGPLLEAEYAITHVFRTQRQPSSALDRWLPDAAAVDAYVRDGVTYATLFRMPSGLRRVELPARDDAGRPEAEVGEIFGFRILGSDDGSSAIVTVFARNGRKPGRATWAGRSLEVRDQSGRVVDRAPLEPVPGFDSVAAAPGAVIPLSARVHLAPTAGEPALTPGTERDLVLTAAY